MPAQEDEKGTCMNCSLWHRRLEEMLTIVLLEWKHFPPAATQRICKSLLGNIRYITDRRIPWEMSAVCLLSFFYSVLQNLQFIIYKIDMRSKVTAQLLTVWKTAYQNNLRPTLLVIASLTSTLTATSVNVFLTEGK